MTTKYIEAFNFDAFNRVGSVNVTSDGIASGFSSANYVTSDTMINFKTANTWELNCSFVTPASALSKVGWIYSGNIGYHGVGIGLTPTYNIEVKLSNSTSSTNIADLVSTEILIANTKYWVRATYDGTIYRCYYSINGIDYTEWSNKESTAKCNSGTVILGTNDSKHDYPFTGGTIDLKDFNITLDGKTVIDGTRLATLNTYSKGNSMKAVVKVTQKEKYNKHLDNLPIFSSADEASNGKDEISFSPTAIYKIINNHVNISVGNSYNYPVIFTFEGSFMLKTWTYQTYVIGNQMPGASIKTIEGSNDQTTWTTITNDSSNTEYYKYYKITFTGSETHLYGSMGMNYLNMTGEQKLKSPIIYNEYSTKLPKINDKYYAIAQ